jgi:hypothetical protein
MQCCNTTIILLINTRSIGTKSNSVWGVNRRRGGCDEVVKYMYYWIGNTYIWRKEITHNEKKRKSQRRMQKSSD